MNPYQSPPDCGEYNRLYDPGYWCLEILKWMCVGIIYTALLPFFLVAVFIFVILGFCFLSVSPVISLARGRKPLCDDIGAFCFCWLIIFATVIYWYLYITCGYDYIEDFMQHVTSPLRRVRRY